VAKEVDLEQGQWRGNSRSPEGGISRMGTVFWRDGTLWGVTVGTGDWSVTVGVVITVGCI